jgi:hypothetical protein
MSKQQWGYVDSSADEALNIMGKETSNGNDDIFHECQTFTREKWLKENTRKKREKMTGIHHGIRNE